MIQMRLTALKLMNSRKQTLLLHIAMQGNADWKRKSGRHTVIHYIPLCSRPDRLLIPISNVALMFRKEYLNKEAKYF